MNGLVRRGFLTLLAVAAIAAAQAPARAADDPEAFTQRLIDQGVAILRDSPAGPARTAKFHNFIIQYADARKIALFTLGSYRRGAPDGHLDDFVSAFTDYATAVYQSRLDQYKGQSLRVTGKVENGPGDYTVKTVVDGNGGNGNPIRVAFRLMGTGPAYKFVDVQVEGIWLSVEQRDQFASFLNQNAGSIPALAANLRTKTKTLASK